MVAVLLPVKKLMYNFYTLVGHIMGQQKIELLIYGITANQVQSGAYALILEQKNGNYRIPIVVGAPEAQSIAMALERVKPERPLTHDLFASFAKAYGIRFSEVFIYKFEEGIFYSEIVCSDGDRNVSIDARTSDAIALALRTGAKIYTTPDVICNVGFISTEQGVKRVEPQEFEHNNTEIELSRYTIEELNKMMLKAASREDYERAAEIRNTIAAKVAANSKKDNQ